MKCSKEFSKSLTILKTFFQKKSDLTELKIQGKYSSNPKFVEYFPELYRANAKKLKRHLFRLLKYTSLKATSLSERADLVADGTGLHETCCHDLDMATKIPLPGLGDDYTSSSLSQKKRLIHLLLTYVILFYKEEPSMIFQDVRLRGPRFTGLPRVLQLITTGDKTIPAQFIEDYLVQAISKVENGQAAGLLTAFQTQLRLQKQLDPSYTDDEETYRRLLYNCCSILSNESSSLSTNSYSNPVQPQRTHPKVKFEYVNNVQSLDDSEDLVREYTNMVLASSETENQTDNDDNRSQSDKIESFKRTFMTPPCRLCGSLNHVMLRNETPPNSTRQYTEYECPVAYCEKWSDARRSPIKNLKYQVCPIKFARFCKFDSYKVMEALNNYSKNGSGRFKKPQELNALKSAILQNCKPSNGVRPNSVAPTSSRGHVASLKGKSSSTRLPIIMNVTTSDIDTPHNEYLVDSVDTYNNLEYTAPTTRRRPLVYIGLVSTDDIEVEEDDSQLHGALHLLIATKVEPASHQEIFNFEHRIFDTNYIKTIPSDTSSTCQVRLEMPGGETYDIRYKQVDGSILPDTGSTTTLINRDFAIKMGLPFHTSDTIVTLTNFNSGETKTAERCYIRLTMTTVTGQLVTATILALCMPDLQYDILLGTKDLERYRVSVAPHMGEARMTFGAEELIFPMFTEASVLKLQQFASTHAKILC
jgi:hypothetical protein